MSDAPKSIRFKAAVRALAEAEAQRTGESFGAVVERCVMERLGEAFEEAPAQVRRAAPRPAKATPADPLQVPGVGRASGMGTEAVTGGGLMKGAMERAGIAEWNPSAKRPQYVRREAKGKGGR